VKTGLVNERVSVFLVEELPAFLLSQTLLHPRKFDCGLTASFVTKFIFTKAKFAP
jgi:hypothetical protein